MTDQGLQARIVLCVLHDQPGIVRSICAEQAGFEYDETYSAQGPDPRMPAAFEASRCTVLPSLTDADRDAIVGHRDVAYVLSPRMHPATASQIAATSLRLVKRLLDLGARAIKCESAGLTHGRERWSSLASQDDPVALYGAWVRRPLASHGLLYSCGMHLLGFPDVELAGVSATDAVELIDGFSLYQLIDRPGDRLLAGHTFSLRSTAPRFRLRRTACERYERDDFFHNPQGYWRLEPVSDLH